MIEAVPNLAQPLAVVDYVGDFFLFLCSFVAKSFLSG